MSKTYNFILFSGPDNDIIQDCYVQATSRQHAFNIVGNHTKCQKVLNSRRHLRQFSCRKEHQRDWPVGTLVIGKPKEFLF